MTTGFEKSERVRTLSRHGRCLKRQHSFFGAGIVGNCEIVSISELNLVWQADTVITAVRIRETQIRWNGRTTALHSERYVDTERTVDFGYSSIVIVFGSPHAREN